MKKERVKLTNTQLYKLRSTAKNKTGTKVRITKKNFHDEGLPHELFLTTRQKTKIRNAFGNIIFTDIKLSRDQLSKIIKSGGFLTNTFGNVIGTLGKKTLMDLAVPLAKDLLPKLATKATSSKFDKFDRKSKGLQE